MLVPLIVACALFMENLDATVLTTALPAIARSLHEDPLHLSLAITTYLLSLAVFIPISGWIADAYGPRRVFRAAILVFVLGSAACGAAQTIAELVAARVLQGLGGAMMVPVGRLLLLRRTPKHHLVTAMSYLTVPALLAPLLGPPVGGAIVTYASWRWIFFINLPIGVLGFLLASRYIRDQPPPPPPKLDWRGWLLAGSGLALAAFSFENLGKGVLPDMLVGALLTLGVALLALYLVYARGHSEAILDLRLLRVPTFGAAIIGGSLFRIGTGAFTLLMPLMLQLGFGLSAAASGAITFASAVGALLLKATVAPIVRHFGFRRLLSVNALINAGFLGGCALFAPTTPHLLIIGYLLASGFFRSLQFTCINTMGFADINGPRMSRATSLSSTAQQLTLAVGVGVAAQLLHGARRLHGGALGVTDFRLAFIAVSVLVVGSTLSFLRLPAEAGARVSGHRLPGVRARGVR
ncbi:MAG: MFS transporter [Gammaproteobacteria bacterium]|nr:MFS transporter [Gammaproteobacteria bacterium]